MRGNPPEGKFQPIIDKHHWPEAAEELEKAKDHFGDEMPPSVNKMILDPKPRKREDEEDIKHGERGGETPEELRAGNAERVEDANENAEEIGQIATRVKRKPPATGANRDPDEPDEK